MQRNKVFIIILLFILLCLFFACISFAELNQLYTATANATLNATIWNNEFDNIINNPNDYADEMSISAAAITNLTGNFTGDMTVTGTITGKILDSTDAITTIGEPTSATGIIYLPKWTVVTHTDSPFTVTVGDNLLINTKGGTVYLNLPTPTANGDSFQICDIHEWFGTNNLLINPKGYYITVSSGTTSTVAIKSPLSTTFTYFNADGGTPGWRPIGYGYGNY